MIRTGVFGGPTALGAAIMFDEGGMSGRRRPLHQPIVSPYFEQMTRIEGGGRLPRRVWPESGQDGNVPYESQRLEGLNGILEDASYVSEACSKAMLTDSFCNKLTHDVQSGQINVEVALGKITQAMHDEFNKSKEHEVDFTPHLIAITAIALGIGVYFMVKK